ncbi:MAG: FimB/Mfa2 family fimbrial subunit [Bacteroidales bacterium]|nr:FimB/Mfa2 family fimbrial subunit [Candidatus Cryptobacteroides choladohippi]
MNFKAGIISIFTLLLSAAAALSSCSRLIYDYEGNCDDYVEIYLKYDYNIERADMRPDHAGYAMVYAVDEYGNIAARTEVSGAEIHDKNSVVRFNGLQPGRYTFTAVAMQKPYEVCAAGNGARFRAKFPEVGNVISDLNVKLDRNSAADEHGCHAVEAPAQGLDTLWIGQSITEGGIVVPKHEDQRGNAIKDTVSLVRDTKYLNLTLHQIDKPAEIYDTDFIVTIVDNNGHLAWDNALLPDDDLLYSPHASWTTSMSEKGVVYMSEEEAQKAPQDDPIKERAAHFELSFSRLMYYASASEGNNATLCIKTKEKGDVVVEINLAYFLAIGRDAYSVHNYSAQEYLDREYHYSLDFFLDKVGWKFVNIKVNTTPWSRRIYNQTL